MAIEAVKETPNNQAKKPIATQVIIKLLNVILTLTNFVINSINYLQEKGVLWVQFAHRHIRNLKNCPYTTTLEIFPHFTVEL